MRYSTFLNDLQCLSPFSIPRPEGVYADSRIRLVAFCDASMVGYGCCVYLHITDPFGNISVRLLCAKSKVSPVKVTTLARLELVAAVLLSNLVRVVKERLETRISVS